MNRIRGRRLQQARARLIADDPLCKRCQDKGRIRLGTQRDHIVALTNGGEDTPENTQLLCDPCHVEKTNEDMGRTPRPWIMADGWPASPERMKNQ